MCKNVKVLSTTTLLKCICSTKPHISNHDEIHHVHKSYSWTSYVLLYEPLNVTWLFNSVSQTCIFKHVCLYAYQNLY